MNWSQQIDAYCERLTPAFWAEPVNALTNAAFIVAAVVMWGRAGGDRRARALVIVLALIGVGSFLFHTVATTWAALADTAPIGVFILLYLYIANRAFWGLPRWASLIGVGLFVPYAALVLWLVGDIAWLGSSAGYIPVPILIFAYALALARRAPQTARGLALGAVILVISLTARTVDLPLCDPVPLGTHFWWHLLNALMLGWMVEVYLRHMLADEASGR